MTITDCLIAAAYAFGPILLGGIIATIYSTVRIHRHPHVVDAIGHSPRSERVYPAIPRQIPATIRHYRRPPAFRAPPIRSYSSEEVHPRHLSR